VSVSVTSLAQLHLGDLPSGLVIAVPVAFNLSITNSSALINGFVRVHYSQALIANQVNEKDLVVLRWGTSTWVNSGIVVDITENYVDIPLSQNGLFIIASTPKQNYMPILFIVLIGITGGIVAAAGYSHSRKKAITQKSTGKSKSDLAHAYSGLPATPTTQADIHDGSFAKRARLMQTLAPGTISLPPSAPQASTVQQQAAPIDVMMKKAGASSEPEVDIAARAASAQQMASEVQVERVVPRCVVHKGPISGLSYTCKHCGVQYCISCAMHLAQSGEKCWNCSGIIDTEGLVPASAQPVQIRQMEGKVTLFDPEVFAKISELGVDDLLVLVKDIPADNRMRYLDDMFKEEPENEGDDL
jgi:hypothetical protein